MTSPRQIVPYGYCKCGCGNKTAVSRQNHARFGWIKGEPKDFLRGHSSFRRPTPEAAQPFKIEGVYCRLIPLNRGFYTIVNESDYLWLMRYRWHLKWSLKNKTYYVYGSVDSREEAMHRLILGLLPEDQEQGDHARTGETLDNRRDNLRRTDQKGNMGNRRKNRNNTSGFKGVGYYAPTRKWVARITINGHHKNLGYFNTPELAHEAYKKAATNHFGGFARFE